MKFVLEHDEEFSFNVKSGKSKTIATLELYVLGKKTIAV